MKFNVVVLTAGKWQGKEISIPFSQFLIGRDPECHLRPSNPLISKRHCVLLTRGDQAFVRDNQSTNGTFVNHRQVKGELELKNGDHLRVGPLEFRVSMESSVPVDRRTPLPTNKSPAHSADEEAAALLLSMQDPEGSPSPSEIGPVDNDGVPTGSTIQERIQTHDTDVLPDATAAKAGEGAAAEKSKLDKAKEAAADTSAAASAILTKYLRRPRT
jgi:pSer/pThr/pTyr-binding forkhead associated (FHA) protein